MKNPNASIWIPGLAISAVFAMTSLAHAKEVGKYSAQISADNSVGRRWTDFGAQLMGWTCYAGSSVRYSEKHLDHKGRSVVLPMDSNSSYNFSLFSNPNVSLAFERSMLAEDPKLSISVSENCHKTVRETSSCTKTRTTTDSKGNSSTSTYTSTCTNSVTKHAFMSWNCSIDKLPDSIGQDLKTSCKPSSYSFPTSIESLILAGLKQKTFKASIKLESKQEKFKATNCSGNDSNRVVIQLAQGVGGHMGENDFLFHVTVDGQKFDVPSSSGILDDEIAYCGAGPQVTVGVTAEEQDLFYSDQYKATGSGEVTLSKKAPSNTGMIELSRKTYLGELFTDKRHNVRVTLLDPRGDGVEINRALSAVDLGRSTAQGSAEPNRGRSARGDVVNKPSSSPSDERKSGSPGASEGF